VATITVKTLITYDSQAGDPSVALPAYEIEKAYTYTVVNDRQWKLSSAAQIVWNPTVNTGEQPTDFDVLIMWSNADVELELTIREGGANEELNSVRLAGGAPPLVLGADDAYKNHSASDAFGGTLDVINKIRVKESNGATAIVRVILAT